MAASSDGVASREPKSCYEQKSLGSPGSGPLPALGRSISRSSDVAVPSRFRSRWGLRFRLLRRAAMPVSYDRDYGDWRIGARLARQPGLARLPRPTFYMTGGPCPLSRREVKNHRADGCIDFVDTDNLGWKGCMVRSTAERDSVNMCLLSVRDHVSHWCPEQWWCRWLR